MSNRKITEILQSREQDVTFSFEVTPDLQLETLETLFNNTENKEPEFYSVTWHAKAHKCEDLEIGPLKLASDLANRNKTVLLHLSCDLLSKEYLDGLLRLLQERGICNLFIIQGENYDSENSIFKNSKELIQYVRRTTGSYFCIGVAGFPGRNKYLHILKEKIDSGANFVITQAFFEFSTFQSFVIDCKNIGINVPILPGIFVFRNMKELAGFTNVCKIKVSDDLIEMVQKSNSDNAKCISENLILNILNKLQISHLHFFTLNKLDSVSDFIKSLAIKELID